MRDRENQEENEEEVYAEQNESQCLQVRRENETTVECTDERGHIEELRIVMEIDKTHSLGKRRNSLKRNASE